MKKPVSYPSKSANGEAEVFISPRYEKDEISKRLIDLGKTASTLAHGVRNPLNAIKGAMAFLSERYAHEPTFIEFADIIEKEILRLDQFISKFLTTQILDGEPSRTDINSLLEKIKIFTSFQASSYRITPHYEFGDIPPASINAFQLEQAILNVINNSIESMPFGGRIEVKTYSKKRSGTDFIVIQTSDTGTGISDGKIDSLCEPSGGRGFGLFIAREVLQCRGGDLEIKNGSGKGTVVRIYIPAAGNSETEET